MIREAFGAFFCAAGGAAIVALVVIALWPVVQPEAHVWIRDGETGCRYVPASEAQEAAACQELGRL